MLRSFLLSLFLLFFIFPPASFAHSQVRVIEMTENGFEPESITIDENETVIFVNKDSQPRWPASNPHPVHSIFPAFDPRLAIQPNDSWTFKPKKQGSFRYHDHMVPHFRGILIVQAEEKDEKKNETGITPTQGAKQNQFMHSLKQDIASFFARIQALFVPKQKKKEIALPAKKEFMQLSPEQQSEVLTSIAEDDPQKPWQYIKEVFKGEAGASGNIHDLAHLAGNLLYKKSGFGGLSSCSREFAFGCYHGFLDEAFAKNLKQLQDAETACLRLNSEKDGRVSGPAASCIHGIGHGVASYYSTNDLQGALKTCRKLTKGSQYCFDGVFMEFARNAKATFYKKDNPLYPCDTLEKEYGYAYSFACGRNQPSLLMSRFQMSFDEIVAVCGSSDSTPFREACFDSIGFSLAATGDLEKVISGCQIIGDQNLVQRCLTAAAGEMVFQEVPDWRTKSRTVCDAGGEGRTECVMHVERLITEYGRQRE